MYSEILRYPIMCQCTHYEYTIIQTYKTQTTYKTIKTKDLNKTMKIIFTDYSIYEGFNLFFTTYKAGITQRVLDFSTRSNL